jgi:hypothetical protein
MKYPNGELVRLGDAVKLWTNCTGIVVASIDTDEFTVDFPKSDWAYLRSGVLIQSNKAGLIHYLEPEPSFVLVKRAGSSKS